MPIYVNTDNSNRKKKLYDATKLGNAAAVEKKMREVVVETLRDTSDFITDKPGKGYSLRMKVLAQKEGRTTTYTVTIEIIRYPPAGKGEEFVPIRAKPGSAAVQGGSDADIVDAIAQLTKSNVKASLGVMRIDMTRR
jgi:hypothetical protein